MVKFYISEHSWSKYVLLIMFLHFLIWWRYINIVGSRSYSTASKVVSQSQIVPSNPNAATLLVVELFFGSSWRNVSVWCEEKLTLSHFAN